MKIIENYLKELFGLGKKTRNRRKEVESKGKIKNYNITIYNVAEYDKDKLDSILKYLSSNLDNIRKKILKNLLKWKLDEDPIEDKRIKKNLDYKKFIPVLLSTTNKDYYVLVFNQISDLGNHFPSVTFKNNKIHDIGLEG
jgi:hypothetical protein|tara:strand:+ start:456 stop:875 length:420 start_codon:yes stop_codon:yes gene_type:complete